MFRTCILASLVIILFAACTEEGDTYITNVTAPEDWQPPQIEWRTQPDPEVRGTVGVDFTISDSSEVTTIRAYLDGIATDSVFAPPYRFQLITDSLLDGVHIVEIRATDEFGNLGISPILRINVSNAVAQGPRLIWVPDEFPRIQDAINAATDFDTIRVRPGTYYETLNTFGKGIWLESELGPTTCSVKGGWSFNTIFFPNGRYPVTVRGFTLTESEIPVRLDAGVMITFANNIVGFDTSFTLFLSSATGGCIANNLFEGSNTAVQISYHWGDFVNNVLENATDFAYWNSAVFENPIFHGFNVFWQNGQDYNIIASPGEGEFNANPMLDLDNSRLLPGSPCIDAGHPSYFDLDSTRSDIGPFGGPLAYQ